MKIIFLPVSNPLDNTTSAMMRCALAAVEFKVTSLTRWSQQLKINPLYAIISDFEPTDTPGVIRIFEMYLGGQTARAIADVFNKENIVTANEYFYSTINKPNPYRNNKNKWGSASIMNIIKNPAYYDAMANGKRKVASFKNHSIVRKDADEWIVVEKTHTPLVSRDMWLEAQQIHLG